MIKLPKKAIKRGELVILTPDSIVDEVTIADLCEICMLVETGVRIICQGEWLGKYKFLLHCICNRPRYISLKNMPNASYWNLQDMLAEHKLQGTVLHQYIIAYLNKNPNPVIEEFQLTPEIARYWNIITDGLSKNPFEGQKSARKI